MQTIQEQIDILIDVQHVEMDIIQADRQVRTLTSEADALDHAAGDHEARLADEKAALETLRKSYRELESESKLNAEMIVKSNEKLRGVKTNKEYQSTLKEIEEIRKKNSGIEDQMLEKLDQIEAAEASVKEKQDQLADFIEGCRTRKTTLTEKIEKETAAVAALVERQKEIGATVDPAVIRLWEQTKHKVRGAVVVPVEKSICTGCHMNIPPQLYNDLQRFDEIRFCPHCHRIIYWQE